MRRAHLTILTVLALSACGDEVAGGAATVSSSGPATTSAPELVIERRAITDAERERLEGDDAPPLDCPDVGEAFWDYDGASEAGPPDRTADDALLEVIDEFNAEARNDPRTTLDDDDVPRTGWIELVDGDTSLFVHTTLNWRFAISVSGTAELNNWRPTGALLCQPAEGEPPPRP